MTLTSFPLCRLLKCRQICSSLFVTSSQPLVVARRSKPDTVNSFVSFCSIKHPREKNVSGRRLFFISASPSRLPLTRFYHSQLWGFFFFFVFPPQSTFCLFIAAVWICCCRPVGFWERDWTGSVVLTSGCPKLPRDFPTWALWRNL